MESALRKKIKGMGLTYIEIPEESLELLYRLFYQTPEGEPKTGIEYLYYGVHARFVTKNPDLTKHYYLKAVELGNTIAMCNLGKYYRTEEIRPYLAKRYYLMAAQANCSYGIHDLTEYFRKQPASEEAFEFALKHNINLLLERTYRDEYQHRLLLKKDKELPNDLFLQKRMFIRDLFIDLEKDLTWFHSHLFPRDITGMIIQYLNG